MTTTDHSEIVALARRGQAAARAFGVCDPTITGPLAGAAAYARKGTPGCEVTAALCLERAAERWADVWGGRVWRTRSGREDARRLWGVDHDRERWGDLGLGLDDRKALARKR